MDRRVKERLVGASILVVLIVLIAPELLSGPAPLSPGPATKGLPAVSAPEPVRHVTVDLATSKPAVTDPATDSTAAASSAAPSAAPTADAVDAAGAAPSAAEALEASSAPPISGPTAAKSAAVARVWSVQLGSFASRANADQLVHQLKAQGYTVYVLSGGSGPAARYKVRVGPLADRAAATQAAAKLKATGHVGSLVPPAA
jgi:DedD protein